MIITKILCTVILIHSECGLLVVWFATWPISSGFPSTDSVQYHLTENTYKGYHEIQSGIFLQVISLVRPQAMSSMP